MRPPRPMQPTSQSLPQMTTTRSLPGPSPRTQLSRRWSHQNLVSGGLKLQPRAFCAPPSKVENTAGQLPTKYNLPLTTARRLLPLPPSPMRLLRSFALLLKRQPLPSQSLFSSPTTRVISRRWRRTQWPVLRRGRVARESSRGGREGLRCYG
ncbi:hypothetical protein CC80DRAFT_251026 [Byssothecium circinans]|uniref:Uncharacterized protein n=1 Tax=Byssothecium circinans TaxID=147558 RepID=A0A6A5TBE0_9PLEO|nr:hypothetical protein CC80DRAFT_251026 [Byssothecium circinans]